MIKRVLSVLLLCASAFGTTTVTGTINNLGGAAVSSGTFVRFYLRGCSGNQPRINGTAIIAPTLGNVYYFDMVPNGSGAISGTLYSTRDSTGLLAGQVECGGSFTSTWYGMVIFVNGKAGPETPIQAKNGATIDISNVTPISSNPVVTAPTGDSTYARLDGGNQPFTGNVTAGAALTVTGATTLNGTTTVNAAETVNGVLTAASGGNSQQIVSQATTNSNQGYSAQNTTQNFSFGIRAASSACAAESFMLRDITNSVDLFCISPTSGNGTLTGSLNLTNAVSAAEAAAPSGVASRDIIYADSTAHRLKMNNNNGGADVVVGAVTTDTVQNKTFTGAGSGNNLNLLNSQDTAGPITGNGADQTVYTYTIPANTVQSGKGIRVTWGTTNNNNVAVTYKLILGATTIVTGTTGGATNPQQATFIVFNNAGVQNAQVTNGLLVDGPTIIVNASGTASSENLANSTVIKLTFNVAASNTVTPKKWVVELIQ